MLTLYIVWMKLSAKSITHLLCWWMTYLKMEKIFKQLLKKQIPICQKVKVKKVVQTYQERTPLNFRLWITMVYHYFHQCLATLLHLEARVLVEINLYWISLRKRHIPSKVTWLRNHTKIQIMTLIALVKILATKWIRKIQWTLHSCTLTF